MTITAIAIKGLRVNGADVILFDFDIMQRKAAIEMCVAALHVSGKHRAGRTGSADGADSAGRHTRYTLFSQLRAFFTLAFIQFRCIKLN